ncbi:HAD family hydrolase [Paenibacillus dokdonensis]|uniref:HAD family hydrolase n=1 Tax=Paenibacillus dokdonensis TaxID=2567944 RepID=A0ABU6GRR8_9BACL|nr:HAD family hydrolase [Paenibacillus dokdonensis]MEC0242461.1 HAD family hydrolase [Paenibacillus dokdonensis]
MKNSSWLAEIKVIIFDMDGTLYQDDTFLERYIRYLLEGTEHEANTESEVKTGNAILTGEHPFGFGHFYHSRDHMILSRLEDGSIKGYTWEGEAIEELGKRYDSIPAPDLVHLGDPWGIAAVISQHYNLPDDKLHHAFNRVRREMLCAPHQLATHRGLFQAIDELDLSKRVLMTNTHLGSGIEFLNYMQIHHLFEEVLCGAEKPAGMENYLSSLLKEGYGAHEILSIGDNPWNDLYPVKRMGGRTCFISPYVSHDTENWDIRLTTLDELEQLIRAVHDNKLRRRATDGTNPTEADQQEV